MHHDDTQVHGHDQNEDQFTLLPDEVYNIVASLHEKSQALQTYEYYLEDAEDDEGREHIEHMIHLDQECVRMCEDELVRLLKKHNRWD
jgi:hypothetical protein